MLSSERLRYRRAVSRDAELLRAHWNRPEVRRYLWDDRTAALATVESTVRRGGASERDFGGGLWCLEHDGEFIGTCGLLPVFPELDALLTEVLDPSLAARVGDAPMVEVLYSLEPTRWGRGFAGEATATLLSHARDELRIPVVFGGTDVPNQRSARVLRAAGMTEVARFAGDAGPLVYFAATMGPSVR